MPQLTIGKIIVNYAQKEETQDLKREIFTHHLYYFDTDEADPIIIDAGAHLGLATLYFKNLYPTAHIIAFEPNPELFKLLNQNLADNNLTNVTTYNLALDKHVGTHDFFVDNSQYLWHSTGSLKPGAWNGVQKNQNVIKVSTDRLGNYLDNLPRVDLLKLDIEGSETAVLLSIKDKLDKIQNIILEFHPTANQNLEQLRAFLIKRGFTVTFHDRTNARKKSWRPGELLIVKATK
jgi:FkbM family methyltransferase